MKINYTLLVIVYVSSILFCCVTADSEVAVADTKNPSKTNGTSDRVNETVDPIKKGKASDMEKNDLGGKLESKGGENEQKNAKDGDLKNDEKENKGSDSESKKEPNKGRLAPLRQKCDSSSYSCTDDDKTLVACLRVPGEESPALSLLIQNKGKGSLNITISAPDLVLLEKKWIELQEKEDSEVKVSIRGVESGHFIILTAGHGNCSLDFRDQFVGRKKADHPYDSSNIYKLTSSMKFLFLAALLIVLVSVLIFIKFWRRYIARRGPKYQKLDMELPVTHGSKLDPGANEGWDDSWGDSWDDEEAPNTPSLPVTPSLSSKGIASRKFSKDGWKD